MEYFHSSGGNPNPDFTYRFLVKEITEEMFDWCGDYPLDGPFERWHIVHNYSSLGRYPSKATQPLIQFESRKAAYMFRITFSEYIIDDLTYSFARNDKWTL